MFLKYVQYEPNNNVVIKHYGSLMIPHDWGMSFKKFKIRGGGATTCGSFWEN